MKIKGIKQGKTIEVLEEINVPDGQEIIIEIPEVQLVSKNESYQQSNEVFGAWKDDTEIAQIFAEIDRERHTDYDRNLEEISFPDSAEIVIEIQDVQLITEEERHQRLKELFSIPMEDREEWVKIGEELDRDRRADFERQQLQ